MLEIMQVAMSFYLSSWLTGVKFQVDEYQDSYYKKKQDSIILIKKIWT
jgi:hypothetical protein